jgi:hypothetical protein
VGAIRFPIVRYPVDEFPAARLAVQGDQGRCYRKRSLYIYLRVDTTKTIQELRGIPQYTGIGIESAVQRQALHPFLFILTVVSDQHVNV